MYLYFGRDIEILVHRQEDVGAGYWDFGIQIDVELKTFSSFAREYCNMFGCNLRAFEWPDALQRPRTNGMAVMCSAKADTGTKIWYKLPAVFDYHIHYTKIVLSLVQFLYRYIYVGIDIEVLV